jgi:hypothetical protein
MSCDRIAEAFHHLPEKQLTGRNRLEGFETQISRPGKPSISFTPGDMYAAVFAPAFLPRPPRNRRRNWTSVWGRRGLVLVNREDFNDAKDTENGASWPTDKVITQMESVR